MNILHVVIVHLEKLFNVDRVSADSKTVVQNYF